MPLQANISAKSDLPEAEVYPSPDLDPPSETFESLEHEDAEEVAEREQSMFGGLGPADAARRRWARERERAGSPKDTDADIETALRAKAAKGDANAARELRAWLTERGPATQDITLESMVKEERSKLIARFCEEEGIVAPATERIVDGSVRAQAFP